jgi:rhodanese-related sulfurtransferase
LSEVISRVRALRGPSGIALAALLLATGALITDTANARATGGAAGAEAGRVAAAGNRVAALDLARWIRDGRPALRLLDVRSPAAFEEHHIATAANLPLADLAAQPLAGAAIVVYDESGDPDGEAERAARILSHEGRTDVRVLSGGLIAWTTEVLRPTIAADASPVERARFEETAALSRWFDGIPRVVPGGAESLKAADHGERAARESHLIRRHGC